MQHQSDPVKVWMKLYHSSAENALDLPQDNMQNPFLQVPAGAGLLYLPGLQPNGPPCFSCTLGNSYLRVFSLAISPAWNTASPRKPCGWLFRSVQIALSVWWDVWLPYLKWNQILPIPFFFFLRSTYLHPICYVLCLFCLLPVSSR